MNDNVLLISYKNLVESSELNDNIDTKIIMPLIKEVQDTELQPVLGAGLFEYLKAGVTANNLNANHKGLLNNFCRPVLIYSILQELPFRLNFRFANTGVVTRTSENAAQPDYKALQALSDTYKAKKVIYAAKLSAYLEKNILIFPTYGNGDTPADAPKPVTYTGGLYLG